MSNEKMKEIPTVEFTFSDKNKSKEEIEKEINEIIKKRDEILASMGYSISNSFETETNDYPRRTRR